MLFKYNVFDMQKLKHFVRYSKLSLNGRLTRIVWLKNSMIQGLAYRNSCEKHKGPLQVAIILADDCHFGLHSSIEFASSDCFRTTENRKIAACGFPVLNIHFIIFTATGHKIDAMVPKHPTTGA